MPESPWTPAVLSTGLRWVVRLLLLMALATSVLALRRVDSFLYPQFWAEDAFVFYVDAEILGWPSLLRPFAGYPVAYARLVSYLGTWLPVVWLPALYSGAALVATGVTLYAVVQARMSGRWWVTALLLLTILTTPYTSEIWLILTNTQWVTALVLVSACVAPAPRYLAGRAGWVTLVALAGLTGPFSLVLLPCVAIRLALHRDRWSATLIATFLACLVATAGVLLTDARMRAVEPIPERVVALVVNARARMPVTIAGLAVLGLLAWSAWRGWHRRDLPVLICATSGLLVMAATIFGSPPQVLGALPFAGGRYVFLPWVLTLWTLLLLADRGVRIAWMAVGAAALVSAWHFVLPPLPRYDWQAAAACLESTSFCHVEVNPKWAGGLPGRGDAP